MSENPPPSRGRALFDIALFVAIVGGWLGLAESDAFQDVLLFIPRSFRIPLHVFLTGQIGVVVALILVRKDPIPWRSLGFRRTSAGEIVGVGLLGLLITLFASAAIGIAYFLSARGLQPTPLVTLPHGILDEELTQRLQWMSELATIPVFVAIPLVVFVGTYEEVLFRGFLLGRLRILFGEGRAWQAVVAVLVSAMLFASGHAYQGILGVVQNLAAGVVFGTIAWRRRQVFSCAFGHVLVDALAFGAFHLLRAKLS